MVKKSFYFEEIPTSRVHITTHTTAKARNPFMLQTGKWFWTSFKDLLTTTDVYNLVDNLVIKSAALHESVALIQKSGRSIATPEKVSYLG